MSASIRFIDLFAGAGGLSEGFLQAEGFEAVAHIEMDTAAANTLKTRTAFHHLSATNNVEAYNDYLKRKITRDDLLTLIPSEKIERIINDTISQFTKESLFSKVDKLRDGKKIDLIIGGPPCQAYSLVGRSRSPTRMVDDHRNHLYKEYAAFLQRYKPKYFVFENVMGLLSAGNRTYLEDMRKEFAELGYSSAYQVLNAADYGVLQNRRRVILIGRLGSSNFLFPEFGNSNVKQYSTLGNLFHDLPKLVPGEEQKFSRYTQSAGAYLLEAKIRQPKDKGTTQHWTRPHNERDLEIYRIAIEKWLTTKERLKYTEIPDRLQTHKNKTSFLDRFKVVNHAGPAHTMVAHIAKDGHYFIYPSLEQVRSLSVREAARIQSFPDNYFFEGRRSDAFRQIGNAVPPLLAKTIAKKIKELFLSIIFAL